ncbi:hypothetical protein RFN25_15470 [Mesorhizobium abyssinicae]|uniref:hypothetical protein n=1 Tax=Mesorhizobium abyssinicae TaxID=1209958 RepID=UPI002A23EB99|nr:hypothetical protein [Mesorhizobium abyssinicae]MDX8434829.1 hypothetical protein [Mesorhizobium abyssinicae]
MALSDDIQMVQKHVRIGERHIAEQRRRILELQVRQQSTEKAQDFLQLLESLQDFHRMHLDRLTNKMERGSADHDDRSLWVVSTSKSRLEASKARLMRSKAV